MRRKGGWFFVAAVAGMVLMARPGRRHGCRTIAQHLLVYGLDGLFG